SSTRTSPWPARGRAGTSPASPSATWSPGTSRPTTCRSSFPDPAAVPAYTPHPEPLEVRHEKAARRLVVSWDDGHESVYGLDYLRSWCPCAGCQGHAPTARYLDLAGNDLMH